jgi:protein SCO1/2
MKDFSRRKFVSMAAVAAAAAPVAALLPDAARGDTGTSAPQTTTELARQRLQRLHLPNVPLITHEGKHVRFYDDLVKNKIVTLNFFFAKCDELCPLVMANLAKVQKMFGSDLGRKIFMYSFTLKPEEDTVDMIKDYRKMYGAMPGWTFLTGKLDDIEKLRKGIGFSYPDPAIDKDKTQHIGNIRYGNEPLMLWAACPGMAHTQWVAESISWMMHPEVNRIQAP